MKLKPVASNQKPYLQPCAIIDWRQPQVLEQARRLTNSLNSEKAIAQRCFEWVRDEIRHSWDYRQGPVTCRASEVLRHGTGFCYAKAHLLAALLRANGIAAGLCYQRLSLEGNGSPYCLHGLTAVYLQEHGWYRVDPRGNKADVDARFDPPREYLAFDIFQQMEWDFVEIYPRPLPVVIDALRKNDSIQALYRNLPDREPTDLGSAGDCQGNAD
ncbi:transglutaminase-like domain-containing protein [Methylomarinum vadi]|uniref:transglutaminase-like domain-containing protein n=1 Tax=Methylomarinum vadi TaxID=438855 RepID=UPI0004DF34C9|nr:transglutaminase family protein [Methylomarinum vadi]